MGSDARLGAMLTTAQFCYYTDQAIDDLITIVRDLGDELGNTRPGLPGANSPYAILTHCLGVLEYWAGHVVSGREDHRDRPAEFTASGPMRELIARAEQARDQFNTDVAAADPAAAPRNPSDLGTPPSTTVTQGHVLMHVYEELAQHLGQLEITRDLLRAH
jgi:uncharacterized damage-inducible protein DinB